MVTALNFETAANTSLSVMEHKAMMDALNHGTGEQRYRLWSEAERFLLVVATRRIDGIRLSYAMIGSCITPRARRQAAR